MKSVKFYLDFDGTITQTDVVDMMLERFADKAWQEVEKEWQEGKIGSRECLSRQLALVKASPEDLEKLCQDVKVDARFLSFLQTTRKLEIPVAVVSDGFETIIRGVLERYLSASPQILKNIPVYSNRLEWTDSGPKAAFFSQEVCRHACANCKPRVIKNTADPQDTILFVGDGLSDRYAAQIAGITFAKSRLLQYCRENEITFEPYSDFGDVEAWLLKNQNLLKTRHAAGLTTGKERR